MPTVVNTVRRMTERTSRYHRPCRSSAATVAAREPDDQGSGTRSEFTRRPANLSRAGNTSTEATTPNSTVDAPANPVERRNCEGNSTRLSSDSPTVSPENATVRPAVPTERDTAESTDRPAASSSRNRLTISRA